MQNQKKICVGLVQTYLSWHLLKQCSLELCHVKWDVKVQVMLVVETKGEKVGGQSRRLEERGRWRAAYRAKENFGVLRWSTFVPPESHFHVYSSLAGKRTNVYHKTKVCCVMFFTISTHKMSSIADRYVNSH